MKMIFIQENASEIVRIAIKISMNFIPKGQINYISAFGSDMAWCWWGNKPFIWTNGV